MSKNRHPDLGKIQHSLNQALEGYDYQCRIHHNGIVSINVAAREHNETFTLVGIRLGEPDGPTHLHLFTEGLRRDLALLESWLEKHAVQNKKSAPQSQNGVRRHMRGQRGLPGDQAWRTISVGRYAR